LKAGREEDAQGKRGSVGGDRAKRIIWEKLEKVRRKSWACEKSAE